MKKKRGKLAQQLERVAPKLEEAESSLRVPEFRTDAEEIAWLDRNYERLAELTEKHGGRVELKLREPTQQISIRLPVRDLAKAKKMAAERRVNYQSVLKRAVRRGLAAGA